MKIPIENIYYLLLYAWDCLEEGSDVHVSAGGGETWTDLAARLLVAWIGGQRRKGLDQGYSDTIEITPTVRGKILSIPTVRYQHLRRGRAVCSVDELSLDTPPNRTVKAVIQTLLLTPQLDQRLAKQLRFDLRLFSSVASCRLTEHLCHYAQTSSNNRSYQLPISVAHLLVNHYIPTEEEGNLRFRSFERDDGPLAVLFESFVLNFCRREQRVFTAASRTLSWQASEIDALGEALLPRMKTDVTLESANGHAVIETKYYAKPLTSYRGSEKFRSSHLFQLAAYLEAHETSHPGLRSMKGVLLYAQPANVAFDVQFRLKNWPIRILTIDLSEDWRDIKAQLLAIIHWASLPSIESSIGLSPSL